MSNLVNFEHETLVFSQFDIWKCFILLFNKYVVGQYFVKGLTPYITHIDIQTKNLWYYWKLGVYINIYYICTHTHLYYYMYQYYVFKTLNILYVPRDTMCQYDMCEVLNW